MPGSKIDDTKFIEYFLFEIFVTDLQRTSTGINVALNHKGFPFDKIS
jgi:hypothetical protein